MSNKWNSVLQGQYWVESTFLQAAQIVAGDKYRFDGKGNYERVYAGREWFRREWTKHRIHDAVYAMMRHYKPALWQQMMLEWPHKAETDPNRLAYTRDERSGEADRQTVTSIGKYLTRHFPEAPADLIRDIVAEHTYGGQTVITTDMDKMVEAVVQGPRSCMSNRFNINVHGGDCLHPYAVYDPSLGWSMAVRYEEDKVMGRCLLWADPDDADNKGFVRSYKRERGETSHSGADEAIESYLRGLGYKKWGCWPDGTPIMEYKLLRSGWLMPYIDGGTQRVDEETFTIDDNGDICADQTSGTACAYEHTCEDCGEGFHEDEGYWVGPYEDRHICPNCIDNYTLVYGRRGNEYYVDSDRAVYVNGEYYDTEYLEDNDIVELASGEFAHRDNVVFIESTDEYYEHDDSDICYAEDTERYELTSDCWQCAESSNWYTDDTDYIEVDGDKYHPDHAPEVDEEDEDEEEEANPFDSQPTLPPAPSEASQIIATIIDERFALAA